MKTIRYEVAADAKFLTKRWGGELVESDLAIALLSARENQHEADCKALCVYCNSDGYSSAYRLSGGGGWEHSARSDVYIPALVPCGAAPIRESWFCSFAPTVEQIANECVESIIKNAIYRQGLSDIWVKIKPDAMAEIRSDWGKIVADAIERYQREGVK